MKTHKKSLFSLLLILLFMFSSNSWATSINGPGRDDDRQDGFRKDRHKSCNKHTRKFDYWWYKRHCTRVPEVDASGAVPVFALLSGGIAFMYERKRRKHLILTLK